MRRTEREVLFHKGPALLPFVEKCILGYFNLFPMLGCMSRCIYWQNFELSASGGFCSSYMKVSPTYGRPKPGWDHHTWFFDPSGSSWTSVSGKLGSSPISHMSSCSAWGASSSNDSSCPSIKTLTSDADRVDRDAGLSPESDGGDGGKGKISPDSLDITILRGKWFSLRELLSRPCLWTCEIDMVISSPTTTIYDHDSLLPSETTFRLKYASLIRTVRTRYQRVCEVAAVQLKAVSLNEDFNEAYQFKASWTSVFFVPEYDMRQICRIATILRPLYSHRNRVWLVVSQAMKLIGVHRLESTKLPRDKTHSRLTRESFRSLW